MKNTILLLALLMGSQPLLSQWSLIAPHDILYSYNDVFFLNNDTGFVVGDSLYYDAGIILKTMDGGQTWDTTFCNGPVFSIQFISDDIGFAASNSFYFYKTIDGGNTWDEITYTTQYYQRNNSIYFKNSTEGYICSSLKLYNEFLFKTTDGGNSWQKVFFPGTGSFVGGGSICFSSNNIAYVGIGCKTFDGGTSWVNWYNNIVTTLPANFSVMSCNDFLTETYGMVGSYYMAGPPINNNRGIIGITHDGGCNYVFKEFNGLFRIFDIVMVDENTSYAGGQLSQTISQNWSVFLKTTDGGDTWYYQGFEIDSAYPYSNVRALCFPSDKIGYAVSGTGQIYKTTNSGGELIPILSSASPVITENSPLLYPNPASEYLFVKFDNLNIVGFVLNIYNLNGQVVQEAGMYVYDGNYLKVNVSHLPIGVYILKIKDRNEQKVYKFIKE